MWRGLCDGVDPAPGMVLSSVHPRFDCPCMSTGFCFDTCVALLLCLRTKENISITSTRVTTVYLHKMFLGDTWPSAKTNNPFIRRCTDAITKTGIGELLVVKVITAIRSHGGPSS